MTTPLYDDSNYHSLLPNADGIVDFNGPRICNFIPPKAEVGDVPHAIPFPDKLIPRSEWPDLIRQKDAEKSWLEDLVRGVVPASNQGSLSFCHAWGTVDAAKCCRLIQGQPFLDLSPESIGGPVTGWRNRGADPADDLAQLAEYGACPYSYVDKPYSLSPSRWKKGWEEVRYQYRATEIWDIRGGSKAFDFAATCAMLGLACASGFQWWSHFISGPYRVLDMGKGKFALRFRNNWGREFGDDGFVDFAEGKGTPDWSFAVRSMTIADVE